jgi:retron-type reverse transcriptase
VRLKRGAYRAKPVKRVQIPKPGGRLRPIGLPALEDKIVQRAAAEVLNTVYDQEVLGFSYGFRPGRNPHRALDALYVAIKVKKVSWVLDADIREFFDTLFWALPTSVVKPEPGSSRGCAKRFERN